jgi:hypothetical protein
VNAFDRKQLPSILLSELEASLKLRRGTSFLYHDPGWEMEIKVPERLTDQQEEFWQLRVAARIHRSKFFRFFPTKKRTWTKKACWTGSFSATLLSLPSTLQNFPKKPLDWMLFLNISSIFETSAFSSFLRHPGEVNWRLVEDLTPLIVMRYFPSVTEMRIMKWTWLSCCRWKIYG